MEVLIFLAGLLSNNFVALGTAFLTEVAKILGTMERVLN